MLKVDYSESSVGILDDGFAFSQFSFRGGNLVSPRNFSGGFETARVRLDESSPVEIFDDYLPEPYTKFQPVGSIEASTSEKLVFFDPDTGEKQFELLGTFPEPPALSDHLKTGVLRFDQFGDTRVALLDALRSWGEAVLASTPDTLRYESDGLIGIFDWDQTRTIGDFDPFTADEIIAGSSLTIGFQGYGYIDPKDVLLIGTDFDDFIFARGIDNSYWEVSAGTGDDTVVPLDGRHFLDGGDGDDVLELFLDRSDYELQDNLEAGTSTAVHVDGFIELEFKDFEEFVFQYDYHPDPAMTAERLLYAADWSLNAYEGALVLPGDHDFVHAHELAMGLRGDGEFGEWTFANGVFRAPSRSDTSGTSTVAHLAQAEIDGEHTLIIAFRGTDDNIDRLDGWGPQARTDYLTAFDPLLEGLKHFVDSEHGPDRVLLTGHSLGGMAAQAFMEAFPADSTETSFEAVTFGSPGLPFGPEADGRIYHVEHGEDIVPNFGSRIGFSQPGGQLIIPQNDPYLPQNDGRFDEHSMQLYKSSVTNLFDATEEGALLDYLDIPAGQTIRAAAGEPFGTNTVRGDAGNYDEHLFGRQGDDVLEGLGGSDTLYGGKGDDTLVGGAAKDELWGDGGADVFEFSEPGHTRPGQLNRDVINDMGGKDRIDLRSMDADTTQDGNQSFELVATRADFARPGTLLVDVFGPHLLLHGNVDDDPAEDFTILVSDRSPLSLDIYARGILGASVTDLEV